MGFSCAPVASLVNGQDGGACHRAAPPTEPAPARRVPPALVRREPRLAQPALARLAQSDAACLVRPARGPLDTPARRRCAAPAQARRACSRPAAESRSRCAASCATAVRLRATDATDTTRAPARATCQAVRSPGCPGRASQLPSGSHAHSRSQRNCVRVCVVFCATGATVSGDAANFCAVRSAPPHPHQWGHDNGATV